MSIERAIQKEVDRQVKDAVRKQLQKIDVGVHWKAQGAKWTADEEDALVKFWRSFIYKAAHDHRRTPKAIIARLEIMYKNGQLCIQ